MFASTPSSFVPPKPGKVAHTSDLSPGAIAAKRSGIQGHLWLYGKSDASLGCVSAYKKRRKESALE